MQTEELRRGPRVETCCRVDVRERSSVWTAITEDVCARGCRVVSARDPRVGTLVSLTISTDAFDAELEVEGEVVWARDGRVGIIFLGPSAVRSAITPAAFVAQLFGADAALTRIRPAFAPVDIQGPSAQIFRLPVRRRSAQ
jgi:hypothetical protein